jgi:hypothetical protein
MLARKKTLGPMKLTDVDRLEVVWNYWRKRFFASRNKDYKWPIYTPNYYTSN